MINKKESKREKIERMDREIQTKCKWTNRKEKWYWEKVGENMEKKERVRGRVEGEIHLMCKWVIIERKSEKGKKGRKNGEKTVRRDIGSDWASIGR